MRSFNNSNTEKSDLVYIIDPSACEVGDIILSTESWAIDAIAIRAISMGPFSHASLCTRKGILVEATPLNGGLGGVQRISTSRIVVGKKRSVRALRLKPSVPDRLSRAVKAAARAEWMISRPYWMDGAVRWVLPKVPKNERGAFFCSHLVAEAYAYAKCPLIKRLAPEKVSPNALLNSSVLESVTDRVFVSAHGRSARANLLKPEEGPHQTVENPIAQRLVADPRVARILNKYRLPPQHGLWDLYTALVRTGDAELDEIVAAAVRAMAGGIRVEFRRDQLTPAYIDWFACSLADNEWKRHDIEHELQLCRSDLVIRQTDIEDRRRDVVDNRQLWLKTGLRSFGEWWRFSVEYLEFMEHKRELLERKAKLLERALSRE